MADKKSGLENPQQTKSCSILRASLLKTSKLSDVTDATNEVPAGQTSSNSFFLRPSPLQQQASLLNSNSEEPTPSSGLAPSSFRLEPPKFLSPLPSNLFNADLNTSRDDDEKKNDSKETQIKTSNGSEDDKPKFIFGEKLSDRMTTKDGTNGPSKDEAGGSFVFGSNLAEKVVNVDAKKDKNTNDDDEDDDGAEIHTPERKEDSSMLSLAESAALQQAKDVKPELKEVETMTGEENESNVLQFNAKLHVFDTTTQNWHERGRGIVRLNDIASQEQENNVFLSRLVMRAQGSLRVILNMMLWSGMLIEKASSKSVKISAVEADEGIKIYLITANPNDAEQIYNAIRHRTQQLKSSEARKEVLTRKRQVDGESCSISMSKKLRLEATGDESNDSSSAPYPETEASNEGFTSSSPAVQSSSSSDA